MWAFISIESCLLQVYNNDFQQPEINFTEMMIEFNFGVSESTHFAFVKLKN